MESQKRLFGTTFKAPNFQNKYLLQQFLEQPIISE